MNICYSKYAPLEYTRAHRTMAKSINFQFNGMHCMLVYSAYSRGKRVHITNARKSYRCSVQLVCRSKRFSILIRLHYIIYNIYRHYNVFKHRKPHFVKKKEQFRVLANLTFFTGSFYLLLF